MNKERFEKLSKILLFYTVLVILWGAWVRISHSGDGCGDTWPLCHGQMIPEAQQQKTWVEYGHRLSSGLYGIFVILLFFWARKAYPRTSRLYTTAKWTLFFMITEALLGAKLVLFKLVGTDSSPFRIFAMSLHQLNSLLLTAAVAFLYFFSRHPEGNSYGMILKNFSFRLEKAWPFIFMCICIAGAWAALSTTLFPSTSLLDGLQKDLQEGGHILLRIRLLHPILALSFGLGMSWYCYQKSDQNDLPEELKKSYKILSFGLSFALVFGIFTLLLLSPIWMKIAHLAIAHALWILWVRHTVTSLDCAKR